MSELVLPIVAMVLLVMGEALGLALFLQNF